MNALTRLAVGKRSVTLLLAAGLFVAGILAWGGLKQELLPDVSFPIVTVIAPYPGAGAADVTEQVTKPLEHAVSGVAGLDQLQSTSSNSFAFVVAQFDYGINIDEAVSTIEENIAAANLPSGVDPTVWRLQLQRRPGPDRVGVGARPERISSGRPRSPPRSSSRSSCRSPASPRRTSPAASRIAC